MIEKNKFFREVSLPLCEYLDLDTAIHHCLKALSRYMPADGMTIQLLEPELKSSRTVFWGLAGSGKIEPLKNTIVPMPPETRNFLKKTPLPDLRVINRPELDPVGRYFMEAIGNDNNSNLAMFLYKEKKRFAVVVLVATGRDRYTEEDLSLFALLREPFSLALNNYLQSREIVKLQQMLDETIDRKNRKISVEDIVGHKFGLRNVINLVQLVAPLDSPVLINGETGVGKELIVAAIHNASLRRDGPLIRVNCGAIPETLVDSELFGHEKGAFTGAITRRKGRFERADHGTIFLDEVGELKPDSQVKLLRVLQNGEIERVGGSGQIQVDVRIVAATHRNLENMVAQGDFREDLMFRINVFPIVIPPLRARKMDIPALVDHFIQKKSSELSIYPAPSLGSRAIDKLTNCPWPGNVRELENAVERELILNRSGPLSFANFSPTALRKKQPREKQTDNDPLPLDDVVAAHIVRVLKKTGGRVSGSGGAAAILGVHPNTLRNRMTKLAIPFKKAQLKQI